MQGKTQLKWSVMRLINQLIVAKQNQPTCSKLSQALLEAGIQLGRCEQLIIDELIHHSNLRLLASNLALSTRTIEYHLRGITMKLYTHIFEH